MSEVFKFFNKKKDVESDDEEAYQEQIRAYNQAKEILRKQQLEKEKQEKDQQDWIKVDLPHIDISQLNQEEIEKLLKKKHEMLISNAPVSEEDLADVKIRSRKLAFSTFLYTIKALEKISKFNENVVIKEKQLTEALRNILQSDSKIKWVNSQAVDVLFSETKKIFDQNAQLVDKISSIEKEKYKTQEQMKEFEQLNHTLQLENKSLKQELEYQKTESDQNLAQVYRLQQKIDEIKRMENEEFYKIKRDEIKLRKELDELRLKYKRSQDALGKFKEKEDEINDLKAYFHDKKQKEEDAEIQKQLKYEKEKLSLIGLCRLKDKQPILCLVDFLTVHELNQIAMLNKSYRNTLWNDCTFIWKNTYRAVNVANREKELELKRQIDVKNHELKTIIPHKDFDIMSVVDTDTEIDLRQLLQKYVCEEAKVGECIQSTMYSTKIFLNKQYNYMQKLFQEEQERIIREREMAQRRPAGQQKGGGLFSRFFSTVTKEPVQNQDQKPQNKVAEVENDKDGNEDSNYLLSTTQDDYKPAENANLIDFEDENDKTQPTQKSKSKNEEKEVPMNMEEKDIQDDEETKRSETATVIDDRMDEAQDVFKAGPRQRSDSLTSTSTTKLYSYQDFNDFVNIDELHKFLYKCGAMLVNKKGKMEEWIDWMQHTLAEYYVYCQILYKQAKDVEILKDFLSKKLQRTKYKLDMVTNEKEDLLERQDAETGIKEHLARQIQDLNIKHIEKTHELVMLKQKLAESNSEIKDVEREYQNKLVESDKIQSKLLKEVKAHRKRLKVFEAENAQYKEIFDEVQDYIKLVDKTHRR